MLLTLMGHSMMAKPVEPEKAMQVAKNFVAQYVKGTDKLEATVVYTHKMPKIGQPAMYVVNLGNMFVIVSADDIAHPVLGYSLSRPWPVINDERGMMNDEQPSVSKHSSLNTHHSTLPPQVASYLDDLATQIEAATVGTQRAASASDNETAAEWSQLLSLNSHLLTTTNLPDSVGPLLTTTWDQGQYYNALCPEDANGPAGHALTGCVATAMAQIINYWGYPVHGRGTHSYNHDAYGTLSANYSNSTYDYAHMPTALSATSTPQELQAVAQLMHHCGVAANMGYGPTESGAYDHDARAAFINFFCYSPDISLVEKNHFTDVDWENMIRADLSANRPVYYSGKSMWGGHAFVCDGYRQDGYFHFNFGWSGIADGWYVTNAVMGYNSRQAALIGIVPDSTGNVILGQTKGFSSFVVDEPLEFYHILGHNSFTGTDYANPCSNTVSFISANNSNQLIADLVYFEDQSLTIYDGNNVMLRDLYGGGNNDMSPIVPNTNALIANYSGNMYYSGFKMIVSQNSSCRMVSNIITLVDTTSIQLSWTENGSATQWMIEYGTEGFTPGTGTSITTNSNSAAISGLTKLTTYDFYFRPICAEHWFGPVSVMTDARYWHEVVTAQPVGYEEDSAGNITISTAEGLAWYSYLRQQSPFYNFSTYNHQTVTLSADIDLGQYKWLPLNFDGILFDGAGHTISNVLIIEKGGQSILAVGFFAWATRCTIKDLSINNLYIKADENGGDIGGIAGLMGTMYNDTARITNCFVNGTIIGGPSTAGGIIGLGNNVHIYNSASVCNVSSNYAGGIGGHLDGNSVVKNCYAGGFVSGGNGCCGSLVGTSYGGVIKKCYFRPTQYNPIGTWENLVSSDLISFHEGNEDGEWVLDTTISFDDIEYDNLVEVLNKGVEFVNTNGLKYWQKDSFNVNLGFPVFGDNYIVTCPNASNLHFSNIQEGDSNGVIASWTENGTATQWQIRYCLADTNNYSVHAAFHNPDTIWGLTLGERYRFSIRPICDDMNHGGWIDDSIFAVNTPYWTDIVTTQPTGYAVDENGNVTISSAEGLAWMLSVVNGLNGQTRDSMSGIQVSLVSDINMSQYLWKAIDGFSGHFDGGNHSISGIILDELRNNQGLFGNIAYATITNVRLENVSISALENVGGLCGYSTMSKIDNCNVSGNVGGGSNVGGLIGLMSNTNICHSSATTTVTASLNYVGGLIGRVSAGYPNRSISHSFRSVDEFQPKSNVKDCYSKCNVIGYTGAGGLIGYATAMDGDIVIENSYAGNTVDGYDYVGGLIGTIDGFYSNTVTIKNCCSYNVVYANPDVVNAALPDEKLNGSFIGLCSGNAKISKCYVKKISYLDFISGHHGTFDNFIVNDTSSFDIVNSNPSLLSPVTIGSTTYNDAVSALNSWVYQMGSSEYSVWEIDTLGYPIFGNRYTETCPGVTTISADSVWNNGVRVKWNGGESVNTWKVEYGVCGFEKGSGTILYVSDTIVTIQPLTTGLYYDFYVQATCGQGELGRCDSMLRVKPDKKYWVDVVTSQPDGYQEDDNGNVYISTAEGLAWLISVSNRLNGESRQDMYNDNGQLVFAFNNKTIHLMQDIDLSEYRWTPISFFNGTFDGHNHSITGLYMNDNNFYAAFIETIHMGGKVCNTIFDNATIIGTEFIGTICIYLNGGTIQNCGVNSNIHSISLTGVLATFNNGNILNCYTTGYIYSCSYFGGFTSTNTGHVQNCYSAPHIESQMLGHLDRVNPMFGQFTGQDISYNLSNIAYWLKSYYNISNSIPALSIGSDDSYYPFSGEDTLWTLYNPQYINGQYVTSLIDALNAWVDANNTEGQYCHWATDSTNTNGGFPVFVARFCPSATGNDSIVACNSFSWHGTVYTTDAELIDTLLTVTGCDSIVTHYLTIKHSTIGSETATACESYFFNNQWIYASGQYTDTLTNISGCDSIVTLNLTINNPAHASFTETACDSYTWYNATLTSSGDYTYPHNDTNGCTQVDTLHLTINHSSTSDTTAIACDSFTWHGTTYTSSCGQGVACPNYTTSNAIGCDSIVTLHLTINNSSTSSESESACDSYFFGGQWIYNSGQYTDTLPTTAGCDSIATLNLTINNPVHTATTVTACDSYTWQEAVITTSGTYHYTHTDAHSCTQDDTLYLTINHNDTVIVDEEVCDSLTWYGTTYTASAYGVQYLIVPNTVGCDSIFFLDLTVNYTTYGEMSAVSCDSYQWDWNGAVYTASGDYTYRDTVNMNSQFCDSVLTLHLTVNYSATSDTTATACDLFVWYGHMGYDVSGNYEHRWWNVTADGCDSILTLHLTINHSAETTVTDTAEGIYTWNGTTYTESGTYTWTGETVEGCDSSVTLILTINQVGIFDIQNSEFKINIFPNPTTDLLTIDADDILSVELFDLNGRRIFSSEVDSSPFTVHLSPFTLSAGSYLLRIHTRQGTAVQHVILK